MWNCEVVFVVNKRTKLEAACRKQTARPGGEVLQRATSTSTTLPLDNDL